jgi:hypothetical protein
VLWFPIWTQAMHVFPLLLMAQSVQLLVRFFVSGKFPGWFYFIESVVASVLWPLATWLLLAPQRRAGPRPHPPDLTPRRSMTEIKDNQRELQQFRLRLTVLGGLVFVCFGLLLLRFIWLQVVKYSDFAVKAEEPHRRRADRAEPRPDPGPQRRGPGAQLLGLHAGDHAVQAEHHAR